MPVPVIAPRLGLYEDVCNSDDERRFLERLNQRAEKGQWCSDSWSHTTDHVLIALSLCDAERNSVMRDLRVDYIGSQLLLGDDETHQFVTPLSPSQERVIVVADASPEKLAEVAADWLEKEMLRPIIREEWTVGGGIRERWMLADDGRVLGFRGNWGWGAHKQEAAGPPTKRTIVWPPAAADRRS